ncbi:protein phosphatase 4, regulatory subunit 2 [Mortierella sp. AD032]|nr:protein phosphatase 4, regulatory subunit 2 [Mortierella sp. AD032]
MAEHHSPSSPPPPPPPPQQQQQQQEQELTPPSNDRLEIIRQIALTNQLTVPWEDVRKALEDELAHVLESNQLTYTSPSVTNPLTTTLTAIPNTDVTEESSIVDASNEEQQSTSEVEVTTTATVSTIITNNGEDQPQVPEQQQGKEKAQETGVKAVADAEDRLPEETVSQLKDEGQAPSADTPATKDDTPEGTEAKDNESDYSTSVEKQSQEENKSQEKTLEQEQGWPVGQDAAKFVPISTNTLLLETPQGYHDRIKGLLDAFPSAPFTIQRVCELVSTPNEHHTNLIKYLRAVEKVLMITSSINEFSNPAYNGPSALDGKDEETYYRGSGRILNGDSQSKDLDFGLISTKMPSDGSDEDDDEDDEFGPGLSAHSNSNISEKEVYDAVLADVDAFEARFGTGKETQGDEGDDEGEDEDVEEAFLAVSEADDAEGTTSATLLTAAVGDIAEQMDVDDVDQSVRATAITSTMEGVESDGSSEEAVVEGGMEVDQV